MTALFTDKQMNELVQDRKKIRDQKFAEKLEPFVVGAVEFYAEKMRPSSQRILDDLKYSNWSFVFDFKSYDFGAIQGKGRALTNWKREGKNGEGEIYAEFSHYHRVSKGSQPGSMFHHNGESEMMWTIYSRTDFRKRLLAELGLDPKEFEFKNLSTFMPTDKLLFKDERIIEYHNSVNIVYTPKRGKYLNPLAEAWVSHVDPMPPLEHICSENTSVTY
jgi:hypothetical protein